MKNKADLNNFDITRGVLSFLVFFTHWNILTANDIEFFLFHLSGIAIDFFFIVSGFLIWWSYSCDQNSSNFYLKRFFRIFPLYFILISLQTGFFIFFSNGETKELFSYFVANIFFLNFLAPTAGDVLNGLEVNAINGSLWTLKNEVAFYILVPLVFRLYSKYGVKFLCAIYVCSVLYMFYFQYSNDERMLVQFPAQVRLFITGILLYIYFDKIDDIKPASISVICLVLVILFRDNAYFRIVFYPLVLGMVLIYIVYYIKPFIIKFDFSYSFYILHFPLIQLAILFDLNPSNPAISFLSLFLLTVLLSYMSELWVEKPFIKLGRSIVKSRGLRQQ